MPGHHSVWLQTVKQTQENTENVAGLETVRLSDWLKININVQTSFTNTKKLMTSLNLIHKYLKTTVISGEQQTVTIEELSDPNSTTNAWGTYDVSNKIIYIKLSGLTNPNTSAEAPEDLPCAVGFDDSNLFTNWLFHNIIHLLTCPQMQNNIQKVQDDSGNEVELYVGKNGLTQYKKCLKLLTSAKNAVNLSDDVIDNLKGFLVMTSSIEAVHTYNGPPIVIDGVVQPVIYGYTIMPRILTCELMHPVLLGVFEDNGYTVKYNSEYLTTDTLPSPYAPQTEIAWMDLSNQPSLKQGENNSLELQFNKVEKNKKNMFKIKSEVNCECC